MNIEFVPLLQLQRDLYRIPRGPERFNAYLKTMANEDRTELRLPPLVAMNPMAKDHVPQLLDALLEMEADAAGAQASAEVANHVAEVPGHFKLGLVVADDLMGGWTNRYTTEFSHRFECHRGDKWGWLSAVIWSSETPSSRTVREEVMAVIFRAAYIAEHGPASSLEDMLRQEGHVTAMAGCREPILDAADLDYTREVLQPLYPATDQPTLIACLFGDPAAKALGYSPQGLSHRAGLALALHDAQTRSTTTKSEVRFRSGT